MAKLTDVVGYLDELLDTQGVADRYCPNGLQVEGRPDLLRVGFTVDACLASFEALKNCDMIIVHHGLFWPSIDRVVGPVRKALHFLLSNEISLYASHLPLDRHPELGNNVQILKRFGLTPEQTFPPVGWVGTFADLPSRSQIQSQLELMFSGPVRVLDFGPKRIRRLAVSSGQATASMVGDAVRLGCDSLLTGEASHPIYHAAREAGINVLLGGHYATETWGVRALMTVIEERFSTDCKFYDHPTGF